MDQFHVYKDIQKRTGGEIYIGVVGPVRTGKSTFIKRFMEAMVLPSMEEGPEKVRARDEIPQSAAGKTIMTTEPKFIPKEGALIHVGQDTELKIRLVDCVGYMVEGASGHMEADSERLVKTPWFDYEIPFTQAAELGTKKVIHDHSTIGMLITCDGSFGELPREAYVEAEEKTIKELKELGKPFLVIVNSTRPYSEDTKRLAGKIQEAYGVTAVSVNCEQLKKEDIDWLMEQVLKEFPISRLDFYIPKWMEILPLSHPLKAHILEVLSGILNKASSIKDLGPELFITDSDKIQSITIRKKHLSDGSVEVDVSMKPELYYETLSELTGILITGEAHLMKTISRLAAQKSEFDKVQDALEAVRYKGYGVMIPGRSDVVLDEPVLVKHGNKYGVKMKAEAPSIHFIKAFIETEIAPIVGTEKQARDLIDYMKENAGNGEDGIWETNIFGKSIEQIVDDGIQAKITQMTEECQQKLQDTLQKIINDSNGKMICIII